MTGALERGTGKHES